MTTPDPALMALASEDARLRDQIAAGLMPAATEIALKGYGHFCPNVNDRACRDAFDAAERFLEYRNERYGKEPPNVR